VLFLDEFGRFVDGEAVRDMVDDSEAIRVYEENEIEHASADVESAAMWVYYKGLTLVGKGSVTKDNCGQFGVFKGCLNVKDHHDHFDAEGKIVHAEGKVYMKNGRHSCDRYSCPECYRRVAFRESVRAEERLNEGSKHFGLVEHVITSVPMKLYHVTDGSELKLLSREVLKGVGFLGGCDVVHAFRYTRGRGWYYGPHVHNLGWIRGGYNCRNCPKVDFASVSACSGCHGFEAKVREQYGKTGWIIKVARDRVSGRAEVRRSIRKTISYELAHASVPVGVKGARLLTWWGVASYRGLHVTPKMVKELCPLCQRPLEEFRYVGSDVDVLARIKCGVNGSFYDDLVDGGGVENWVPVSRDRFGRKIG